MLFYQEANSILIASSINSNFPFDARLFYLYQLYAADFGKFTKGADVVSDSEG